MPVQIRLLNHEDACVLDDVAADVFDGPVDRALTEEFLADPRHHLAVAIVDGTVVGIASAVHYVHPDKPPQLWINEVGVAPNHQRKGIGRLLLLRLLAHGGELGCSEAWVGTEVDNRPARALYQSIGGREAPFVMYSYSLSED